MLSKPLRAALIGMAFAVAGLGGAALAGPAVAPAAEPAGATAGALEQIGARPGAVRSGSRDRLLRVERSARTNGAEIGQRLDRFRRRTARRQARERQRLESTFDRLGRVIEADGIEDRRLLIEDRQIELRDEIAAQRGAAALDRQFRREARPQGPEPAFERAEVLRQRAARAEARALRPVRPRIQGGLPRLAPEDGTISLSTRALMRQYGSYRQPGEADAAFAQRIEGARLRAVSRNRTDLGPLLEGSAEADR